ncbi:MAG TPA: beta-ketoacyl-[acyl-carrier-protein] synthase family protein, partial [Acidimicrobiales bacterium]|nr:beta-ketoacyl-[acyl-carrier-protein] synthase family protein [Acidimicrobiales bacterium]
AGANALGLARDRLWSDEADVMLAGGCDSLTFFSLSGFAIMGSLDTEACSPYSRSQGLTLGEGAAVLVVEPLAKAKERGAHVIAELLGWGTSADAYHASAPDPTGRGAALAMRRAIDQAGISPDDVDYINGHGTATPANDAMERKAMRTTFGERATSIPCSSTKSMIGHTLGAAGAVEAAVCALATRDDLAPPTANFDLDKVDGFDFVPNQAKPTTVDVAISNNYAFGGSNGSVVIAKPGKGRSTEVDADDVVITGIGAVGPLGIGFDAWRSAMLAGDCPLGEVTEFDATKYGSPIGGQVPKLDAKGFAPGGAWRKMDTLGRHCVAASRLAWRESGLDLSPAAMEAVGVIFGTNVGSIEHTEMFDRGARQGATAANPILFPNAVLNSAAGQVCMTLGLRGPTVTMTSGGVSSALALVHAADLIRRREAEVVLVMGADTLYETVFGTAALMGGILTNEKVRPFDEQATGTALAGTAVTVVLESAAHAAARSARTYCQVLGWGMASDAFNYRAGTSTGVEWGEAMRMAVERSGISTGDIGYVASAACGIRTVDELEAGAISKVIGSTTPVSAPKSMAGETLGAAGLVNVMAAILALDEGAIVPTVNLERPLADIPLDHVRVEPVQRDVSHALVNSVGLGGNYVSTVLGQV